MKYQNHVLMFSDTVWYELCDSLCSQVSHTEKLINIKDFSSVQSTSSGGYNDTSIFRTYLQNNFKKALEMQIFY